MPILDTVSVDIASGKTVLGWEASTSPDTRKYYIYQQIGGPWQLIDSVFGINNTFYTNLASNPFAGSESYSIAAVDSCDKLSAMGLIHSTIFLQTPTLDACADRIALSWSSYVNMDPPLSGYRIYVSENSAPYVLIGTTDSLTTYFEHHGFTENSNYCYYIQAYSADMSRTSTSNFQCVIATKPNQPKYVYMRYATVVNNEHARIGFFVDSTAYITAYKILRADDGFTFDTIDVIYPTTNKANVSYTDVNAEVQKKSYYYKVVVVDSCNLNILTSNTGRTIYLDGYMQSYLLNYLSWNIYEDRYASEYKLFREVENFESVRPIATFVWNETNYADDVDNYTESQGRFTYFIQAHLYDLYMGMYQFSDTVLSNEVLILQEPRLYVPTAFVPDGYNNIFKPIGVFADTEDYYFTVYNRWGQKVFETTDIREGWDGKFNGSKAPLSVYAYYVRIKDATGKYIEKNGTVTLIR
jgi:gliding motility-associated-like protein